MCIRDRTTTDTLIHNSYNHPIQHILAAFRTMIHRLNIPLDEKDYKDELNTIKYLAESNRYDKTIVNKLLHKTNNRQRQKQQIHNNNIHQQPKIAHKFKKAGYRIAYKTTNKTEHTLSLIHI